MTACEKADIQRSETFEKKLVPRGTNCNNCPTGDCCCRVSLGSGTTVATLIFCGTTNPEWSEMVCEFDLEDCPDIEGYYWSTNLSSSMMDPDEFFCVAEFTSFMIGNTGLTSVNLIITCQYGVFSPQVINIMLGPGERLYYNANGDCELSSCHPS